MPTNEYMHKLIELNTKRNYYLNKWLSANKLLGRTNNNNTTYYNII